MVAAIRINVRPVLDGALRDTVRTVRIDEGEDSMRTQTANSMAMAAALALAVLSTGARADDVTITGCAQAGVESGCVVMNSGGTLYNITAAKPAPKIGAAGRVTGTVLADSASFCQQGTILAPATWAAVDGIACPDAAAH